MTIRGGRGTRLWLGRLGWLVLIWAASVAAIGLVALLIRSVLRP